MLTRALKAAHTDRTPPEKLAQDTRVATRASMRKRQPSVRKRDQVLEASSKIGKYISHALPVAMRAKHHAEIALTINQEHFSGLSEVLPQLDAFKYKAPPMHADALDGALLNTPANMRVDAKDFRALVKEDKSSLQPLEYLKTDRDRLPYAVAIGADNTLSWTATGKPIAAGEYIFVWGQDHELYASTEKLPGRARDFRHSSFFSGASVLFAGEFTTDDAGHILAVNNKSGHYRPDFMPWVTFLSFLRAQGVDVNRIKKTFVTKSKRQAFYLKWLQRAGSDTGQVEQVIKARK